MKIVFLGTPDFVKPIRDILAKHFTLTDKVQESDLIVVAAFGKILSKEVLDAPKYGSINIHPSLLPKYRGPSPIQAAILNGDKISGITIIKMDEEMDHGPVIYQESLDLSDKDNFDILSKKMFLRASEVLPQIIEDFVQGEIKPKEQNSTSATYCKLLTRESGYFDIDHPPSSEILNRMIRAYYPWPGTWTRWSPSRYPDPAQPEKDLKIVKFLPSISHPELDSGSIKFLIQMEGKKAISLRDFLNGYPEFPIKQL